MQEARSRHENQHWTDVAWPGRPLAISSWTLEPEWLLTPGVARLLVVTLEMLVLRHGLRLHGFVVLPGSLHVVTGVPASGEQRPGLAWPVALGRLKARVARWCHERNGAAGPAWSPRVRVRPLGTAEVEAAVRRCHEAPVLARLVTRPADWPHSSWDALHERACPDFVRPVPHGSWTLVTGA